MISMFFGGFCGSNLAGLLMDRLGKFKIIGICAISGGKILYIEAPFTASMQPIFYF